MGGDYRKKIYQKYLFTDISPFRDWNSDFRRLKQVSFAWQKYFGRFLPEDKNAGIIDIGCGSGGLLWWLQKLGYKNTEGIDISEEQIEIARKLGINNVSREDVMDFLNNSFKKYNIIFMRNFIEHFEKEDIVEILDKTRRLLKEDGILILQTLNLAGPFGGRLRYYDFTHETGFTKHSMSQLLLAVGFKDVKVFSAGPVIHGLKSLIRLALWKFIELCLRIYLLIEIGFSNEIFTQTLIVVAKK